MRLDDEDEDQPERGKQDDPMFLGVGKALYKARTVLISHFEPKEGSLDVRVSDLVGVWPTEGRPRWIERPD